MKKLITLLLTIALASVAALSLVACSKDKEKESNVVYGFNYTYTASKEFGAGYNGYATVSKYVLTEEQTTVVSKGNYSGNMLDLVVPDEVTTAAGKYKVTKISDSAFANQTLIKSITFGKNIETFGAGCLAGCSNLQSLTIPFAGASKDAVNVKKTVAYLFGVSEATGTGAATVYYNNGDSSSSTTYYIPTSLKTITLTGNVVSEYAFNGMPVENIVLSGKVTEIPEGSFANLTAATKIELPATVKTIGKAAFRNSSSVININLDKLTALESIGAEAFSGCTNLFYEGTLKLVSVNSIGKSAFNGCVYMEEVDLASTNLAALTEKDFYGCSKLTSVKLPANIALANYAFGSCKELKPENVLIGNTAVTAAYQGADTAFDQTFFG